MSHETGVILDYVLRRVRAGDYDVSGFRIVLDCPLPDCKANARKRRHFYVNRDWYFYRCYRTGEAGSFKEAVLADPRIWSPVKAAEGGHGSGPSGPQAIPEGLWPLDDAAPVTARPVQKRAYDYLLSRGVSPRQIKDHRIGVRSFDHRVYFPFWDDTGRVTFEMGRVIGEARPGEPKTLDSGFPKPLYGLHVAPPAPDLFIVEGVFDYFATPGSVSTLGSHLDYSQQATIRELYRTAAVDRVFTIRDPDAKDKARHEVLSLRSLGVPAVAVLVERTQDDPADLGLAVMADATAAVIARPAVFDVGEPFVTLEINR